ncbi:MAG: malate dehydrogenase [Pseudanabaenaceae cyanobacterium bins.68]|nr:malate dehydrogenase [Pseudanabaenaceae cyanobacterium bins.68]
MLNRPKVTIIGTGNVGSALAQRLLTQNIANVVLVDVLVGKAAGIALDLYQAGAVESYDREVIGTDQYADTANSDVIVVTAGVPRKPGMDRNDLLRINAQIVTTSVPQAIAVSPEAIVIVVTNPLDVITYLTWQVSGLPPQRVIGMAGALDTARFQSFIAQELNISSVDVRAIVMGGHGDLMVPLPRYASVNGIPLTELLSAKVIAGLLERTRHGGAEIVQLLQTGSAYFAPAAATHEMIEAILSDRGRIIPASAYLSGEYGLANLFMGVPIKVGKNGVEQVLELKLTSQELELLEASAQAILANIAELSRSI